MGHSILFHLSEDEFINEVLTWYRSRCQLSPGRPKLFGEIRRSRPAAYWRDGRMILRQLWNLRAQSRNHAQNQTSKTKRAHAASLASRMLRNGDSFLAADYANYANGAHQELFFAPHSRNSRNPRPNNCLHSATF